MAESQSKMPPQQSNGLLHLFHELDDLGAHKWLTFSVDGGGSIEAAGASRQPAFFHRLLTIGGRHELLARAIYGLA
jgi:hypothetical protein